MSIVLQYVVCIVRLFYRYGAAEQDCSVALQLDSKYTKAIARRATAREKLKKYKEAKKDYESLLKYEPKNKQALSEIEKINKVSSVILIWYFFVVF